MNGHESSNRQSGRGWEREEGTKALWNDLMGIDPPEFEDERDAPPVNLELLVAVARREVAEAVRMRVYRLIVRYRSWWDGYDAVLMELCRKVPN